jgi:hypothetical protein
MKQNNKEEYKGKENDSVDLNEAIHEYLIMAGCTKSANAFQEEYQTNGIQFSGPSGAANQSQNQNGMLPSILKVLLKISTF